MQKTEDCAPIDWHYVARSVSGVRSPQDCLNRFKHLQQAGINTPEKLRSLHPDASRRIDRKPKTILRKTQNLVAQQCQSDQKSIQRVPLKPIQPQSTTSTTSNPMVASDGKGRKYVTTVASVGMKPVQQTKTNASHPTSAHRPSSNIQRKSRKSVKVTRIPQIPSEPQITAGQTDASDNGTNIVSINKDPAMAGKAVSRSRGGVKPKTGRVVRTRDIRANAKKSIAKTPLPHSESDLLCKFFSDDDVSQRGAASKELTASKTNPCVNLNSNSANWPMSENDALLMLLSDAGNPICSGDGSGMTVDSHKSALNSFHGTGSRRIDLETPTLSLMDPLPTDFTTPGSFLSAKSAQGADHLISHLSPADTMAANSLLMQQDALQEFSAMQRRGSFSDASNEPFGLQNTLPVFDSHLVNQNNDFLSLLELDSVAQNNREFSIPHPNSTSMSYTDQFNQFMDSPSGDLGLLLNDTPSATRTQHNLLNNNSDIGLFGAPSTQVGFDADTDITGTSIGDASSQVVRPCGDGINSNEKLDDALFLILSNSDAAGTPLDAEQQFKLETGLVKTPTAILPQKTSNPFGTDGLESLLHELNPCVEPFKKQSANGCKSNTVASEGFLEVAGNVDETQTDDGFVSGNEENDLRISRDEVNDLFQDAMQTFPSYEQLNKPTPKMQEPKWVNGRSSSLFSWDQIVELQTQLKQHLQLCVQAFCIETVVKGRHNQDVKYWETQLNHISRSFQTGKRQNGEETIFKIPGLQYIPYVLQIEHDAGSEECLAFNRKYGGSVTPQHKERFLELSSNGKYVNPLMEEKVARLPSIYNYAFGVFNGIFESELIPYILPLRKVRLNTFSAAEDKLLFVGVLHYGFSDWASIRAHNLPARTSRQIKSRCKNLVQRRCGGSEIRELFLQPFKPFTVIERHILKVGIDTYGSAFKLMAPNVFQCPDIFIQQAWNELVSTGECLVTWDLTPVLSKPPINRKVRVVTPACVNNNTTSSVGLPVNNKKRKNTQNKDEIAASEAKKHKQQSSFPKKQAAPLARVALASAAIGTRQGTSSKTIQQRAPVSLASAKQHQGRNERIFDGQTLNGRNYYPSPSILQFDSDFMLSNQQDTGNCVNELLFGNSTNFQPLERSNSTSSDAMPFQKQMNLGGGERNTTIERPVLDLDSDVGYLASVQSELDFPDDFEATSLYSKADTHPFILQQQQQQAGMSFGGTEFIADGFDKMYNWNSDFETDLETPGNTTNTAFEVDQRRNRRGNDCWSDLDVRPGQRQYYGHQGYQRGNNQRYLHGGQANGNYTMRMRMNQVAREQNVFDEPSFGASSVFDMNFNSNGYTAERPSVAPHVKLSGLYDCESDSDDLQPQTSTF